MEIAEYLDVLRGFGPALAEAAAQIGFEAEVPSCPGWNVGDVVRHTGSVHRWAAAIVSSGSTSRQPFPEPPADGLLGWYREGVAALVDTLEHAPDDLTAWTFYPAASAKAFWARRQAHETVIHQADVELARGLSLRYPVAFSVDGIDELLTKYLPRGRSRLVADRPATLLVSPADADIWWHVTIGPDGPVVRSTGDHKADATVRGSASDLYLYLWNRQPEQPVHYSGDDRVLEVWRRLAR